MMSSESLESFVVALSETLAVGQREAARAEVEALQGTEPGKYHLGMASILMGEGAHVASLEHAAKAAELFPDEAVAWQYLAVAQRVNGQLEAAITSAQQAAIRDASTRSYHTLGRILMEAGQLKEAEQAYRRGLEWEPESSVLLSTLGAVLDRQGQAGEALDHYVRAFDAAPGDGDAIALMTGHLREQGWVFGAMTLALRYFSESTSDAMRVAMGLMFVRLLGQQAPAFPGASVFPEADEVVAGVVESALRRPLRVQVATAHALFGVQRFEAVKALLEGARRHAVTDSERSQVLFIDGLMALEDGEAEEALELYQESFALDAARWEAATNAIQLLLRVGGDEAMAQIESLLDALPETIRLRQPPLALNEAIFWMRRGELERARQRAQWVYEQTRHGPPELQVFAQGAQDLLSEMGAAAPQ